GGGRRYGPAAGIPAVERPRLAIESAVRLRRNVWQGRARLELHVEDLRPVPEVAARPVGSPDRVSDHAPVNAPGRGADNAPDQALDRAPNHAPDRAPDRASDRAPDHPDRSLLAGLFRSLRRLAADEAGTITIERAVA